MAITTSEIYELNHMNRTCQRVALGTKIQDAENASAVLNIVEVAWDQADDGDIAAAAEFSTGVTLPDNAIVLRVTEDMLADSTSSGGTCQLLVGTGGTAISATNVCNGTPEVVSSSTGLLTKTSAATELFIAGAGEDLDDGSLRYWVEYVVSV